MDNDDDNDHDDAVYNRQPVLSPEEAAMELARAVREDGVQLQLTDGYLDATYEVKKAIGKGKFSTVYKAIRRVDQAVVALKQIAFFDILDSKSRLKCLKEIKLVQTLEHPNIIRYMDGFLEGNVLYLVFEYAEAGDLKRQIRKAREREARFDERVVWKYFSQIAEAVAYMHSERAMHRDLKPANIFLTLEGQVKVGDLGLGRFLSEETLAAQSRVGTPLYMSPEVLRGHGYDWSSDVWSLGCLLYELAMLRNPFKEEGLNLYGLFAKISEGQYVPPSPVYSDTLKNLVEACLQLEPSARPTAEQVATIAIDMREQLMRNRNPTVTSAVGSALSQGHAQIPARQPMHTGQVVRTQERRTPSPSILGAPLLGRSTPPAASTARTGPGTVAGTKESHGGLAIGKADRRGPVVAEHWPDLEAQAADSSQRRHATSDRLRTSPVSVPGSHLEAVPRADRVGVDRAERAVGNGSPSHSALRTAARAGSPHSLAAQEPIHVPASWPVSPVSPLYHAASIMDLLFSQGNTGVMQAVQHTLHSTASPASMTQVPLHAVLHDSLVDVLGGPAGVHARTGPGRAPSMYDLLLHVLHVSTQDSFLLVEQDMSQATGAPSDVHITLALLGAACAAILEQCLTAARPEGGSLAHQGRAERRHAVPSESAEQRNSRQEVALWLRAVLAGHESEETLWTILLQSPLPVAIEHADRAGASLGQKPSSLTAEWIQLQAGLGVNPRAMVAPHARRHQLPCILLWLLQVLRVCMPRGDSHSSHGTESNAMLRSQTAATRNVSPEDTAGQLDGYEDDFEEASAVVHERTAVLRLQADRGREREDASDGLAGGRKEADDERSEGAGEGKAVESAQEEALEKFVDDSIRLPRHRSSKSDE